MNFEKRLEHENIVFTKEEYDDNVILFKMKNRVNVVFIESNSSIFSLDRDLCYYLDNQKVPYSFVLVNKGNLKTFFLEFKNNKNWMSDSFKRCDKEELYFGKQILNHTSDYDIIIKKIKNIENKY